MQIDGTLNKLATVCAVLDAYLSFFLAYKEN